MFLAWRVGIRSSKAAFFFSLFFFFLDLFIAWRGSGGGSSVWVAVCCHLFFFTFLYVYPTSSGHGLDLVRVDMMKEGYLRVHGEVNGKWPLFVLSHQFNKRAMQIYIFI